MRRVLIFAILSLLPLTIAFFGCGKDPSGAGGTCPDGSFSCGQRCDGDSPPMSCGESCSATSPCQSAGFYCGSGGTCTSDCVSTGDSFCPNGTCTSEGVCEAPPDAGSGTGGGGGGGDVCARESVETSTVTPNVVILIDQSGSMQTELEAGACSPGCDTQGIPNNCYHANCQTPEHSRWNVLRDVLIGTGGGNTGLIGSLEDQVRFGVALYSAPNDANCPAVTFAPLSGGNLSVALNNYSAISSVYAPANPVLYTPTSESMNRLMDELDEIGLINAPDPTIIILATDGEPAQCGSLTTFNAAARNASVAAVASAYSQGVRTFVLAVAAEQELNQTHVNELANAGVGDDSGTTASAPSWRVNSLEELESALEGIIQGEISCAVNLQGQVQDLAEGCATGEVAFIGAGGARTPIACDSENGWTLVNQNTMVLHGNACETFRNTPGLTLDASFPCGVVNIDPE